MSFAMTRARRRHAPAMAETLAAVFVDEPAMCWLLDCDANERHRRLRFFFRPIVSGAIANGVALRSANDEAITLWRTPGKIHPGFFELLGGFSDFGKAIGDRRERTQKLGASLRAHEPSFAYRYLQFAGVAPSAQGKGLGGAAVRAGLKLAQDAQQPVYLETSKRENFNLYAHLGFAMQEEWEVPDGPHVWSMLWRPA